MVLELVLIITAGMLLARCVEWLFVALIKTIAANFLYYRPLLAAFFIQLKFFRKAQRTQTLTKS